MSPRVTASISGEHCHPRKMYFIGSSCLCRQMTRTISAECPSREIDLWCQDILTFCAKMKEKDTISDGRVIEPDGLLILRVDQKKEKDTISDGRVIEPDGC